MYMYTEHDVYAHSDMYTHVLAHNLLIARSAVAASAEHATSGAARVGQQHLVIVAALASPRRQRRLAVRRRTLRAAVKLLVAL